MNLDIDPELDLVFERTVPVSPERVFRAWTEPELIKKWFTPAPWKTVEAEIDLRPGGRFRTVMESPEGERFDNTGCVLEVEPNRKLAFTDALGPGYRPLAEPFFSAIVLIEPAPGGTRYTAIARHGTSENRRKHEEMGFHTGWSTALDQLVALMQEN
jgi:uncharacterized protein YndB with AHSA1/START domain